MLPKDLITLIHEFAEITIKRKLFLAAINMIPHYEVDYQAAPYCISLAHKRWLKLVKYGGISKKTKLDSNVFGHMYHLSIDVSFFWRRRRRRDYIERRLTELYRRIDVLQDRTHTLSK